MEALEDLKLTKKIYTEKGIVWGAFLGGPMVVGYFLIENYKNLDNRAIVNKAWGITIISTVVYFIVAYFITEVLETLMVSLLFLFLLCMVVARKVFKRKQALEVEAYIKRGGKLHSNWRVAGISIFFFIVTIGSVGSKFMFYTLGNSMLIIPAPVELVEPTFSARSTTSSRNYLMESVVNNLQSKSYGEVGNILVYNDFFFSESKIDSIAEELTRVGFFEATNPKNIYLEKLLFDYEFSIRDTKEAITNKKTWVQYEELRSSMEAFLKDGKVTFFLIDEKSEEILMQLGEAI